MNHGAEMDYQVRHAKPHVGHVDLSSLAFKQACSLSPWQEVQRALRNLSNDPNVHVIVLSGSGGGIDRGMQECIATILQCVKPVICVTFGPPSTLPVQLVCACDIRISSVSASFALRESEAADPILRRLLPKLVGNSSWIFDVTLSGREFSAREALRAGLVSNVLQSDDEALKAGLNLAAVIAARNPSFLQRSKQALWRVRNIRARAQEAPGWNSGYSEAEIAADLDRVLGVGSLRKTETYAKL